MKMKRLIVIFTLLAVILASSGAAYALTIFAKKVASYGKVEYTSEVTITESKLDGSDIIKVKLQSNANTVADRVYIVHLYLNGEEVGTLAVSWTAPQIPGNTKSKEFEDLDLSAVTFWEVEVTQ